MSLRREKFGLPLLQRELTELSARPRTFLTRAVYAVIFFGLIGWQFGEQFSRSDADALLDLGRGRQLFDQLVLWQLGGVCLFMPILTSGAIASEKERGTLSLLMITHLSPMLILIEKLASRAGSLGRRRELGQRDLPRRRAVARGGHKWLQLLAMLLALRVSLPHVVCTMAAWQCINATAIWSWVRRR